MFSKSFCAQFYNTFMAFCYVNSNIKIWVIRNFFIQFDDINICNTSRHTFLFNNISYLETCLMELWSSDRDLRCIFPFRALSSWLWPSKLFSSSYFSLDIKLLDKTRAWRLFNGCKQKDDKVVILLFARVSTCREDKPLNMWSDKL